MPVKIISNVPKITKENAQSASLFLKMFADEVVRVSTPKTPQKTGRLRANVQKQVLGLRGKIVWGQRYAIYQEKKQFANYTTPGTGPHFAENAINEVDRKGTSLMKKAGLI